MCVGTWCPQLVRMLMHKLGLQCQAVRIQPPDIRMSGYPDVPGRVHAARYCEKRAGRLGVKHRSGSAAGMRPQLARMPCTSRQCQAARAHAVHSQAIQQCCKLRAAAWRLPADLLNVCWNMVPTDCSHAYAQVRSAVPGRAHAASGHPDIRTSGHPDIRIS